MLVGAFYFPGWARAESWYCIRANRQALHPLLGYYREGDPGAAEWHIRWALEHGVSFFAFDHYTQDGSQWLETALDDGFLRARSIGRFRFCLNWCNHGPASLMTEAELEHFADLALSKYLKHPSYLRIDGKPVVMILAGCSFVKTLGVERARAAFARFEQRCKDAGLGGLALVFGEGEVQSEQDVRDGLAAGARNFFLYNYPYAGTPFTGPGKAGEASYAHLIEQGERLWKHWRAITGGRFWPTVMPGWDRRPWTKDADLVRTGSTPDLFERSLRQAREHVNGDRVVLIEAWNEWGEGSVLEPSVEHRFAYLDRVRRVFCPGAGPHTDTDPATARTRRPVFNLELPAISCWRFDRDAEGWTSTAIDDLRAQWGTLTMVTRTNDPQLTSPATYLRCADYPQARIRMRATPPPGAPEAATGQLFWSTVDHGLSEAASVHFQVALDGRWHDYTLDLSACPRWAGVTDRFRLDPVDVPGVRVDLDEIRLCRRGEAGGASPGQTVR